uniref:Uncharacterized protein n=1 Tax=Romanomermis culicivorax TaxID=13658 RepID=A0A915HZT9_ROMCU
MVDVLFAIKKSHTEWHKPEQLRDRLVNRLLKSYAVTKKNSTDDIKISRLILETCRKDTCVHGDCRDLLTLDDMNMVAILTSSSNLVSPRHKKSPECICHEGYEGLICDKVLDACHTKPCPSDQLCIPDDSPKGYSCSCTPTTSGSDCRETINCQSDSICAESALNFNGQGFVKYTLWKSLSVEMELSLQFRTTSPFGTLMFSSGTNDFHSLEIHSSILQYRIDLGSGENFVSIKQISVTDGQWHRVKIVRKQKNISLQLDSHKRVEHSISGAGIVLNLYGDYLYFGSEVWNPYLNLRSSRTRNKRTTPFRGCINSLELNGYALTTMGNDISMRNVKFGCTSNEEFRLSPDSSDPCASVSCQNGGTCYSSSPNSFFCQCPPRFVGLFCDKISGLLEECPPGTDHCLEATKNNICSLNPCKHEGLCVLTAKNDDFMCNCTVGWSGQYCEVEFPSIPNITAPNNWSSIFPELVSTAGLLFALILICLFVIAICKRRNRFRLVCFLLEQSTFKPS